jgi:hypothetical protein
MITCLTCNKPMKFKRIQLGNQGTLACIVREELGSAQTSVIMSIFCKIVEHL